MDSSRENAGERVAAFAETVVRVRYAETDQMGVVYHANYLVWMEVGRVEFCRSKGIAYRDMEEQDGVLLVVAEVNCRYSSPALYDEEVAIRTRIAEVNPRVVRFEYEMASLRSAKILATGWTKHVFCGADKRPARLPRKYWALFGIPETPV
jgi:acyl-CoA thioester hydrolase